MPANWSSVATMTDHNGDAIVQGNSFVVLWNGTYYMAFNDVGRVLLWHADVGRFNVGMVGGKATEPQPKHQWRGENSENLVFLSDGTLPLYISNGNS